MLIIMFSSLVLPSLPAKLGGFNTEPVRLVVKPERSELFLAVGISVDGENASGLVKILAESATFYVVETDKGFVQIRKEFVNAIVKEK